jgi:hypothetical protein
LVNTAQPLDPWERAPVAFVEEDGWALGTVWKGVEKISYADRDSNSGLSNP